MFQYLLLGIIQISGYQMSAVRIQSLSWVCRGEGRFPHPLECGSYVECVGLGGGLFPRLNTCPGGAYNPHTGRCTASEQCRCFLTVPDGSGGWKQQQGMCPNQHQVYSQELGRCSDPDAIPRDDPCSARDKVVSHYTCTFWQLLFVVFFPHKIATICSSQGSRSLLHS
nr:uncharacterized protein LOC128694107 [Cherax quadricarinatus]